MKHIVCLDIETTGRDIKTDRIVQLSMMKFDSETYNIVSTYDKYIKPSGSYVMTLPALAKHHITPAFLEDKQTFSDIAEEVIDFIKGTDLLGYNLLKFDLPIIQKEFARAGIEWHFTEYNIWDSFLEEKRRNGNRLEDTFARYKGQTMEEAGYTAHNSMSDVQATIEIFKMQQSDKSFEHENILTESGFINYQDLGDREYECFSVGKYSGIPVEYVMKTDSSYIDWILNNKDFGEDVKNICRKYKEKYENN